MSILTVISKQNS
jgi:hypothetical protein